LSSKDLALLSDILESARLAVSYVRDLTEEQFVADTSKQDAVIYRIGVIGEAARNVSEETRNALALRWSDMTGMRNRVFHGYKDVRIATVWTTVTNDLPQLIATLERYLAS
jgi:uncharacterized protein with HEPN domain